MLSIKENKITVVGIVVTSLFIILCITLIILIHQGKIEFN